MTTLVRLSFDDARVDGDRLVTSGTGRVDVETRIASVAGGTVVVAPAPSPADDGAAEEAEQGAEHGKVLRFPSESAAATPPRAVLTLTAADDDGDPLSPGERPFAFGASFELDPVSQESGPDSDNGNNLVQRGLAGDPSQYKLQVDHGHASCRVRGDEGTVLVKSGTTIHPGTWYSVRCVRVGDRVGLELRDLAAGTTERVVETGATGSVTAAPGTEVSVGGKINGAGTAVRLNSDQFNGAIDDVFLLASQPRVS